MLEFIASTIGPWIDLIEFTLPPLSCILSMTDSTTSAGWLRKSNFTDDSAAESDAHLGCKMELARDHALRLIHNDIKEYSQWFAGTKNGVSDCLSRDFHLDDHSISNLLTHHFSSQLPTSFEIAPLPHEIELFLSAWLLKMPASTPSKERRTRSGLQPGIDGQHSARQSKLTTTPSSEPFPLPTKQNSSAALPSPSATKNIRLKLSDDWLRAQSELPWTMWLRPSGTTSCRIRDSTKGTSLHAFYLDSTKATRIRTHQQNNKKPFPSPSSASS